MGYLFAIDDCTGFDDELAVENDIPAEQPFFVRGENKGLGISALQYISDAVGLGADDGAAIDGDRDLSIVDQLWNNDLQAVGTSGGYFPGYAIEQYHIIGGIGVEPCPIDGYRVPGDDNTSSETGDAKIGGGAVVFFASRQEKQGS